MSEYIPTQEELNDKLWRLTNLYYITNKSGEEILFNLNWAQKELYHKEWHQMLVLKARQLGVTTYFSINFLDDCFWHSNTHAGIIAHRKEDAEDIFKKKVKYAYDRMPEWTRTFNSATNDRSGELAFENGSSYRVSTGFRSGTYQRLLVSEFGKICAKSPDVAKEIVTGSLNTVSTDQVIAIESTAEGRSGYFYDYCQQAESLENQRVELSPMQQRFFFFPWFEEPGYRERSEAIIVSKEINEYLDHVELERQRKIDEEQRRWYEMKQRMLGDSMKQEYPSCIAVDMQILTSKGVYKIQELMKDDVEILDKFYNGIKQTFQITTRLGYSLKCTGDHLILSNGDFKPLNDLAVGDKVLLGGGGFFEFNQFIRYLVNPFTEGNIEITEDFSRFIGYFMGDGSFNNGTVSISCDAKDTDVISDVEYLLNKFIGKNSKRSVGSKLGGIEVRVARRSLIDSFYALDLIRQNASGSYKRKISVPDYIKKSPEPVVRNFLRGLFEADGFAQKNGSGVRLFSKLYDFVKEIQILLLQFGITCRLSRHVKKGGSGHNYIGYDLSMRKRESQVFSEKIGFVSKRKSDRLNQFKETCNYNEIALNFEDIISSIDKSDFCDVYDITTPNQRYSANGIIVHNCPKEAFESANEGLYYGAQLAKLRSTGALCRVPYDDSNVVHTAWDIGLDDFTSIWCFQVGRGGAVSIINFYENWDEGASHYCDWLNKQKYRFGRHIFPHDARKRDAGSKTQYLDHVTPLLEGKFVVLDIKECDKLEGIQTVRSMLSRCVFDEEKTSKGFKHLEAYKKVWDDRLGCYKNTPLHDEHSHACFVGETLITTSKGCIPIKEIKAGDLVLTPLGYKRVIEKFSYGAGRLIEITTNSSMLLCTYNHKIFSEKGLILADSLGYNDILFHEKDRLLCQVLFGFLGKGKNLGFRDCFSSMKMKRLSISMDIDINGTDITIKKVIQMPALFRHCSEAFGRIISEKSMKGFIFIIKTQTQEIIILRILRKSRFVITCDYIIPKKEGIIQGKPLRKLCFLLKYGMLLKKGLNGIGKTAKSLLQRRCGLKSLASCAGISTQLHGITHDFALMDVNKKTDIGLESIIEQELAMSAEPSLSAINTCLKEHVLKTVKLNLEHIQEVYDLNVEGDNCYYANGILVSNSDAFRYLAVGLKGLERKDNSSVDNDLKAVSRYYGA